MYSLMHVNNEIGAVMPIEVGGSSYKREKSCHTFSSGCQHSPDGKLENQTKAHEYRACFQSVDTRFTDQRAADFYIKDKTKIKPIIYGGGQQKGMRYGTENVPAYAGLGVAAEEIYTDFDKKIAHMYELRDHFIESV